MNILFGALFIIIMILPGIIFRVSYLNIPYARKTFKSSFLDELLFSLVPALIIQVPCYSFVNYCLVDVNESVLYLLLINSDKVQARPIPDLHISLFLLYSLIVTALAWWLGKKFRQYVKKKKLYFKMPIFRFYNDWHYIFAGLLLDAPNQPGETDDVKDLWVDAMVEMKDGSIYLYSGYLKQYILTPDEGLDRIYLTHVQRRPVLATAETVEMPPIESFEVMGLMPRQADDPKEPLSTVEIDYINFESTAQEFDRIRQYMEEKQYYYMPGDYFVIPYSEIKNLNITYQNESRINELLAKMTS